MNDKPEFEHKPGTAFPLAKVIVIGFIIFVAFVVILPALRGPVVGPGGRAQCANNMRQLSAAIFTYETIHNQYPGYIEVEMVDGVARKRPFLWKMTPYLERQDVFEYYSGYAGDGLKPGADVPYLPIVTCPSNPVLDQPINSFVLNTGLADGTTDATTPADWPENGVFHSAYPFDDDGNPIALTTQNSTWIQQHDGISNTISVSESLTLRLWSAMTEPDVGFVWQPTNDPPSAARMEAEPIAGFDPYLLARPSSNHPDFVNVMFCDNHYQVLSKKIDYRVYCQLLAPHDAGTRRPGKDSNDPIPKAIRDTPLSVDDYR